MNQYAEVAVCCRENHTENGWSVMKIKVKGFDDLVTLVGNLFDVPVGSVPLCEGDWKVDARYGQQFVAET